MHRLACALLSVLPGALAAQTANYSYLDQRAPYSNPTPALLEANNLPKLGSSFELQVPYSWRQRNGVGTDYVLATGLSNPDIALPPLGGFLFTSADALSATPMSPLGIPGRTTLSIPIPNSVALQGLVFFQQILEVNVVPSAIRLSRGGRGVIGT